MIIGIPHSLFYYYYFPFWSGFFQELGWSYVVSPPTDHTILHKGLSLTVDESCLPVKIHFGHLAYLAEKADYVFSPGFGKWGRKGHFCPKLAGLPDMAIYKFTNVIEFWHDQDEKKGLTLTPWQKTIKTISPGMPDKLIRNAWKKARQKQLAFYALWEKGYKPPEAIEYLVQQRPVFKLEKEYSLQIAVLGHPYLVYDEMANQQILKTLAESNIKIYTKETVPPSERDRRWPLQDKEVFWPIGQQILAAGYYYATKQKVDGIIFLSACLCGPDAVIGELLERYLSVLKGAPPLLKITIDEHTGQAGLQTRVEALIDLLMRRKNYAAV